jgi:hypothetical protein
MITIRPFLSDTLFTVETPLLTVESVFSQLLSTKTYSSPQIHRSILFEDTSGKSFRFCLQDRRLLKNGEMYHLLIDHKCPFLVLREDRDQLRVYDFLRRDFYDPAEVIDIPLSDYVPSLDTNEPYQLFFDYNRVSNPTETLEKYGIQYPLPEMSIYVLEEQLRPWLTNLFYYCSEDPGLPEPKKEAIVEWVMDNLEMSESKRPILDKALTVLLDCIPDYREMPTRKLLISLAKML